MQGIFVASCVRNWRRNLESTKRLLPPLVRMIRPRLWLLFPETATLLSAPAEHGRCLVWKQIIPFWRGRCVMQTSQTKGRFNEAFVHLKALWDCGSFKSADVNGKRKERYTLGMRSWIRQNRQSPSDLSSTRIMENSSPAGGCLKKYKAFAEEQTSRFPRALGRWRAVSMNPLH